jgi:siroheme synthase
MAPAVEEATPTLSGIPVMHRGLASAFLVVSGHAEEADRRWDRSSRERRRSWC